MNETVERVKKLEDDFTRLTVTLGKFTSW